MEDCFGYVFSKAGLCVDLIFNGKGRPLEVRTLSDAATLLSNVGYSSSGLKALSDEAARLAMKENAVVGTRHYEAASMRVLPSVDSETEALNLSCRWELFCR